MAHHRSSRQPRRALVLAAVAALVLGCMPERQDEAPDLGTAPDAGVPELTVDRGVDVADAPPADEVPARDARLVSGGWPEAAAYVAQEAEEGRPTLVNIFASWCGPCRSEMPMLVEASKEHDDIAFLGIDHVDRFEDGEAFVDEFGVDFATIHDLDGDVAHAVGSRGMPTTVVFDRDGRLAARVVGELTETSLAQLLDQVR